jgi:alkanesulfonate monooxygenase SsuD/methylene tetrahydromethanopterin reductase-like flavin-dependent oxidoreductase (luciferase family)
MDNIWIVGSPDDVVARLEALHDEVGGFGGILQLIYDWDDQQARNFRSLELMATEVLPRLKASVSAR